MGAATKKRRPVEGQLLPDEEHAAPPVETPDPALTVEALAADPEPQDWLSAEDFTSREYEDRVLPHEGKRVRIRYLTSPEVSQLAYLPALRGFNEVFARLAIAARKAKEASDSGEALPEKSAEEIAREESDAEYENQVYLSTLAHMALVPPKSKEKETRCSDCSLRHRPAAFPLSLTRRLKPVDLRFIATVAMSLGQLDVVSPLSQVARAQGSPEPASTGE